MKSLIKLMVSATFLGLTSTSAHAQWPEKNITWVVPFAAGGPMDTVSRPVAKKMADLLGVPIVIENKTGAGGITGMDAVARSKPDGYTIGIASIGTQAIAPNHSKAVRYDPFTSFTNIGLLGKYVNVLVVKGDSTFTNPKSILAAADGQEGMITFGSAGVGASNHLSGELFAAVGQRSMTHVPYRGSAPALTDLLAGNISFMFDTMNTTMARFENGTLKALAVTSPQRSPFLPDVPTMDEAGIVGYGETGGEMWWGVVGPAGIEPDVLKRLNQALNDALNSEEIKEQFKRQYVEAWPSSPEQFSQVVRGSHERWGALIRKLNISTP
jgi:tripartite-type tricarboxylate transporter receptor subunit TctC